MIASSIGKSLEALTRRIRPYLSPSYRRAFDQMVARGMKEHREGEPLIVCDFTSTGIDAVGGRYYASMVRDFIDAGYFPVFVAHRATVSSFVTNRKKSDLLKQRFGVVRSLDELQQPFHLITDHPHASPPPLAETIVTVVYEQRLCRSSDEMELPFFVHPQIASAVELPHPYRVGNHRTARILFSGNTTEGRYAKNVIGDTYHIMNRRKMLEVATGVAGPIIQRPPDARQWLDSNEVLPFVMFETQHVKIPRERWIDSMARADFYLACPGVGMPLCHNLIEAMAGGAIPILQYANYLPVPLENGVNALTFVDEDSLRQTVATALAMPQEEVLKLHQSVWDYYQAYLAPGCFTRRLVGGPEKRKNLLFNAYRTPR